MPMKSEKPPPGEIGDGFSCPVFGTTGSVESRDKILMVVKNTFCNTFIPTQFLKD